MKGDLSVLGEEYLAVDTEPTWQLGCFVGFVKCPIEMSGPRKALWEEESGHKWRNIFRRHGGPFHAASQNSFYLKDVQEPLKLTLRLTVLGLLELFIYSGRYHREEAVLCSSAPVITEDSREFSPCLVNN